MSSAGVSNTGMSGAGIRNPGMSGAGISNPGMSAAGIMSGSADGYSYAPGVSSSDKYIEFRNICFSYPSRPDIPVSCEAKILKS